MNNTVFTPTASYTKTGYRTVNNIMLSMLLAVSLLYARPIKNFLNKMTKRKLKGFTNLKINMVAAIFIFITSSVVYSILQGMKFEGLWDTRISDTNRLEIVDPDGQLYWINNIINTDAGKMVYSLVGITSETLIILGRYKAFLL